MIISISEFFLAISVEYFKPFLFQRGHSDRGQARAKSLKFGERFKHIIELLNLYAGNGNAFSRSDLD